MTIRAVGKAKRRERLITCPDCNGARESVRVTNTNRNGEPMEGIVNRNVMCETCDCTGKVRARRTPACCCSAGCEPCDNCAPKPSAMHVCINPDFEDYDYAAKIAMMDTPKTLHSNVGRDSTAADMGVGERSGQRGNR